MQESSGLVAWGILIGSVVTSVVGAAATLLTLWFTKGTDSRVRIIKAEADAKAQENHEELVQKDIVIEALEKRVTKLEATIEAMREQGHLERNKWHEDQLKCAAEAADLRGQLKVLSHQFDQLYSQMYPHTAPPPAATAAAAQAGPLSLGPSLQSGSMPVTVMNPSPIAVSVEK